MQRFAPLFALVLFAAALVTTPAALAANSDDACTQPPAQAHSPRQAPAVAAVRG